MPRQAGNKKIKHYFLTIVSHNESEPDEIKIELSLESLWNHLSNFVSNCSNAEYLWSIIQLEKLVELDQLNNYDPCAISLSTPWQSFYESTENEETFSISSSSQQKASIADTINHLCDDLDSTVPYTLDIVWIVNSLRVLPHFQDNINLYGAIKRAIKWHKARLTLCNCEDANAPFFTWHQVIPLQILAYPFSWEQIFVENVFWRGSIYVNNDEDKRTTKLCGFQLRSLTSDHFCTANYSDNLLVMEQLPLTSIPPYLISSLKCQLLLPTPSYTSSSLLQKSWNFLSDINSRSDVALLIRIGIRNSSRIVESRNTNYKSWKDCHINGNVEKSEENEKKLAFSDSRVFLLIGDGLKTPYSASLYLLRSLSSFNFASCHQMNLYNAYLSCDCRLQTFNGEVLISLPYLTSEDVKHLEKSLLEWQRWALEKWRSGEENQKRAIDIAYACGAYLINKCRESRVGFRAHQEPRTLAPNLCTEELGTTDMLENDSDWPERLRLKKIQSLVLKPQRKMSTMEYLSQMDNSKKEASNITVDSIIKRVKPFLEDEKNHKNNSTNSVMPLSAINCQMHNVFYNQGENCEKIMEKGMDLMQRFLDYETVSSFNCNEIITNKRRKRLNKENSCQKRLKFDDVPSSKVEAATRCSSTSVSLAKPRQVTAKLCSSVNQLNERHLKKLRIAVVDALDFHGVNMHNKLFRVCAKKLFEICKTFAKDVIGRGSTSQQFGKLAMSHVQQVVQFHKNLMKSTSRN